MLDQQAEATDDEDVADEIRQEKIDRTKPYIEGDKQKPPKDAHESHVHGAVKLKGVASVYEKPRLVRNVQTLIPFPRKVNVLFTHPLSRRRS